MLQDHVEPLETLYRQRLFAEVVDAGRRTIDELGQTLPAKQLALIHRWIGLAGLDLGNDDIADPSLHVAVEWDPTDREVSTAYGRLLIRQERHAEAWDVLESVLLHHGESMKAPALAEVAILLGQSYLGAGDANAARRHAETAFDAAPSAESRSLLADTLEATGDRGAAAVLRRDLMDAAVDSAERAARGRRLADTLRAAGREAEAGELMESLALELDAVLDERPGQLGLFEEQTRLLAGARSWVALHDAYARMIARLGAGTGDEDAIRSLLWRKMGDVSSARLGLAERANEEYERADEFRAKAENVSPVYEPTGMHDEASPVDSLWRAILSDPTRLELVEDYGLALAEAGNAAYARTVLQTVVAQGGGGDDVREAVRASRRPPPSFQRPLTDELRNRFVRPKERRAALDAVFHIAYHLVRSTFSHDLRDYDVHARDHLANDDSLPVSKVFREVSAMLGFARPPDLYANRRTPGMSNAFTLEPTFLIGPDDIRSADDALLRFRVAQLLTMSRPRFFLAGLLPPQQLLAAVAALTGAMLPGAEQCDRGLIAKIQSRAKESMSDRWRAPLRDVSARILESAEMPRIEDWLAMVSAEAARTGLLCAGDPAASLDGAERYGVLAQPVPLDARRADLALYALSPECDRARRELGAQ